MDKKVRIVTYSTISIVIILPMIMFLVGGGWAALKFILFVASAWVLIFLLNKFLPVEKVYGIFVLLWLIASHFLVGSWLFDGLLAVLAIIFYIVTFKLEKKGWSYVIAFALLLLCVYAYSLDGFHVVPDISHAVMEETEKEMTKGDGIEETIVNNEEDRLYCTLNVTSDISESGQKKLGQTCAKFLSQAVAKDQNIKGPGADHLGDVYDDYELIVMINEADDDSMQSFLRGVKGKRSDKIIWDRTESDV